MLSVPSSTRSLDTFAAYAERAGLAIVEILQIDRDLFRVYRLVPWTRLQATRSGCATGTTFFQRSCIAAAMAASVAASWSAGLIWMNSEPAFASGVWPGGM